MSTESRERLREKTGAARKALAEADSRAPDGDGELVGRVVVLRATADHPVEWAVIDRRPGAGLLLVPLDDQPLVGSADLSVPMSADGLDPSPQAPVVLRCGHAVEVARSVLEGEGVHATGRVSAEVAQQARALRRRFSAGEAVGTVLGREVDREPEYREWIETVVRPAAEALEAAFPAAGASRSDVHPGTDAASAVTPPMTGPTESTFVFRPWAVVAAALLVVALGLGQELLRSEEERARLVAELEEAPKSGGSGENETELRQRVARLEDQLEASRQQLDAMAGSAVSVPDTLIGLPLAVLSTALSRGEPTVVQVAEDAPSIALVIQLEPVPGAAHGASAGAARYDLRISTLDGDTEIASRSALGAVDSRISLLVPGAWLPPGAYRLRLVAEGGAEPREQGFVLIVERPR